MTGKNCRVHVLSMLTSDDWETVLFTCYQC